MIKIELHERHDKSWLRSSNTNVMINNDSWYNMEITVLNILYILINKLFTSFWKWVFSIIWKNLFVCIVYTSYHQVSHPQRVYLVHSNCTSFGAFEITEEFIRVRVTRSLVFCVLLCRSLFVLLSFFSFGPCMVCPSTRFTASDHPLDILDLWRLTIPLIS